MSTNLAVASSDGVALCVASETKPDEAEILYPKALLLRDVEETTRPGVSLAMTVSASETPPRDVLDLLASTVRFAEAVLQAERDRSPQFERLCFDSLADLKSSIHRVVWSRNLE